MRLSIISAVVVVLTCSAVAAAAVDTDALEPQLREDLRTFIRAKAPIGVEDDAVSKTVEAMTAQIKSSFPGILALDSATKTPTEEVLTRDYSELQRVAAGAPSPVLILFYVELWQKKALKPEQAIVFDRLMRAITSAAEKQKNQRKEANQALEHNAYVRHAACGARVAPATGVAHL